MNTRKQSILDYLEQRGELGATGMGLMRNGSGVDYRKRISDLRRDDYTITDRWEGSGKYRYKRYFLEGTQILITFS